MVVKISIKRIIMYIVIGILLFQDSLTSILQIEFCNYIDELFILSTLIYALAHTRKIPKFLGKFLFFVLLFWFIGVVSAFINSEVVIFPLFMGSILMVKCFALIFSVVLISPDDKIVNLGKDAIYFWGWISVFAGIINGISITLWKLIIPYAIEYKRLGFNSIQGLFIHSGQYGWYMLFVAILYFSECYYTKNKKKYKNVFIMVVCAIFSMKVKVLIAILLIVAYVYFILEKRFNIKKVLLAFTGIGIILVYFGNSIYLTFIQYFTNTSANVSARYALLHGSIEILKDYFPLGVGFSKFGSYYASIYYSEYYYKYGINNIWGLRENETFFGTDTFWPAIFGETGFVGTVIYILVLFMVFSKLLQGLRKYQIDTAISQKIFFALIVIIQAIAESTGEPIFNSSPQNIFIGMSVGIGIASSYLSKKL